MATPNCKGFRAFAGSKALGPWRSSNRDAKADGFEAGRKEFEIKTECKTRSGKLVLRAPSFCWRVADGSWACDDRYTSAWAFGLGGSKKRVKRRKRSCR